MNSKIIKLKNIYFIVLISLFILIIATPYLINKGTIYMLSDDWAETVVLLVLMAISVVINQLYQDELQKNHNSIDELLKYIGGVNVQVSEIKSYFADIKKYPATKNDMKNIYKLMADKVLSVVNVDWVVFKIIEDSQAKILSEYSQVRGGAQFLPQKISSQELINKAGIVGCEIIKSNQENSNIAVYCVCPQIRLNKNQRIFLNRLVDDLCMLYLIFSSVYYKGARLVVDNKVNGLSN